jgi:hypothetical protein
MNRAQRRANAAKISYTQRVQNDHACDFTGGVTCNLCGRTVHADEIPALIQMRFAAADEYEAAHPEMDFTYGANLHPPRLTQQEQINEIAKRVDARRVEGHAVIRRG